MMRSYSEADEDQFFDSHDEITSVSDLGSDSSEDCSSSGLVNCVSNGFGDEFWTKYPESVHERRARFLRLMGLGLDWHSPEREERGEICSDESKRGMDRIRGNNEPVLANSDFEDRFLSCQSSPSCQSNEHLELVEDVIEEENLMSKISNLVELGQDETLNRFLKIEDETGNLLGEEFHKTHGLTSLDTRKKVKRGWMQKLSAMARIVNRQEMVSLKPIDIKSKPGASIRMVHVRSHKKRSKELSSLYSGQEFLAHKGSILAMKFSPDGQYLASAGADSIVRVWKVIEEERQRSFDIQNTDPSCLYFSLNHLSKLAPLRVDKEKIVRTKRLRKSSESACIIFPPKVFRIFEKPVHEFCGHRDEVLALSWSNKGYLLSSSVDKTVRLWRVGHHHCLRVFSHNNYVTCVEFNPVDDNYFISGSIDGKVRIWEVHGCKVVDWIDIREIVSAVCYCPDGKGGIVGSMDGNCRFYNIIDNRLQLGAQICLQGKKKLPGKRITGFQFSPSDLSKVMVTSADSHIRILCGVNVICRFKGIRSSGSQISASFTSDGKHIVSASEDSNVYMWNFTSPDRTSSRVKNISSYESFLSHNASIAIPWCGTNSTLGSLPSPKLSRDDLPRSILDNGQFNDKLHRKMPLLSPDCFSLSCGFFLESIYRGSATWPEEKLPHSSPGGVSSSTMYKSEFKFLKNAYQSTFSTPHMWGHVIVTAGLDGRIRTYLNYGLPIHL